MQSAWTSASSDIVRRVGAIVLSVGLMLGLAWQASVAQDEADEAHVIFEELNDSGITGFATLTADGDQTVVQMRVDGALGDHPTHIHQGQCEDLDPNPEIPLTNVQLEPTGLQGTSETTIDVSLDELLTQDRLILIHRSEADLDTYLACGNIVAGELPDDQRSTGGDRDPLPGTGVGPQDAITYEHEAALLALAAAITGLTLVVVRGRRLSRN